MCARRLYAALAALWLGLGILMGAGAIDSYQNGQWPFLSLLAGFIWVVGTTLAATLLLDARRRLPK